MKHNRDDYNQRIQDTAGIIPDDEPVLLIRGQDPAGPAGAEAYANLAELSGAEPELVSRVKSQAEAMREWQRQYPETVHPADL